MPAFDGSVLPSVKVELGVGDPSADPTWLRLNDALKGKVGVGKLGASDLYADVSSDARTVGIRRGRRSLLEQFDTGSAAIELDGWSGAYDPTNTSGPYVRGGVSQMLPRKPVRVTATSGGQTFGLFAGAIDSLDVDHGWGPSVTVSAIDGFGQLGGVDVPTISPAFRGDTTGRRVGRILDVVGWSTSARVVDAGASVLQPAVFGASGLQLLQQVATAEQGRLFINRDGSLRFADRRAALNPSPPQLGDQAGDIAFSSVKFDDASDQIFNRVSVTAAGGKTQIAQDFASQATYDIRSLELTDLPIASDPEALALAQFLLAAYSQPRLRVSQVVCDPGTNIAAWQALLAIEVGGRLLLRRHTSDGRLITADLIAEGVSHDIDAVAGSWTVTFSTTQTVSYASFVLGVSHLDSGTLGY